MVHLPSTNIALLCRLGLASTLLAACTPDALILGGSHTGVARDSSAANTTVLYRFTGPAGAYPLSGVIADRNGSLYGTTPSGGAYSGGTIYELRRIAATPGWAATTLYSFSGEIAAGSYGPLVADRLGNFYGTIFRGGAFNDGAVFELQHPQRSDDATWTYTVLHDFTGGKDGIEPTAGLVFDSHGNLFGTTSSGGPGKSEGAGTVFELLHPRRNRSIWNERVIYEFGNREDDGESPGQLTIDAAGDLYGTNGGGKWGWGLAWELRPSTRGKLSWKETILHQFGLGSDGQAPNAVTLGPDGNLYGATRWGGRASCGFKGETCGTIYRLARPSKRAKTWNATILFYFPPGGALGANPVSPLSFDAAGSLYGTAEFGGNYGFCSYGCGAIFKLTSTSTESWSYAPIALLPSDGSDGRAPMAGIYFDPRGDLVTTAELGSENNDYGTVIEVTPST
jgi:hypothetical protein